MKSIYRIFAVLLLFASLPKMALACRLAFPDYLINLEAKFLAFQVTRDYVGIFSRRLVPECGYVHEGIIVLPHLAVCIILLLAIALIIIFVYRRHKNNAIKS